MATRLGELRRLMDQGYEILSIDTDEGCMLAVLQRGDRLARVRLYASDAEALLFQSPARARR